MINETLPDADAREDARDGEMEVMEVIRERLDGAPLPGWRAIAAGWLERLGAWFGADPTPSPSRVLAGATAAVPGAPTWERRLTPRQKLTRGGIAMLAVALALLALLNGTEVARSALSALDTALNPPQPAPSIAAAEYALQRLPPPAQHLGRIALAPSLSQSGAAYACWVNTFRQAPSDQRGVASVYRTTDLATTWTRLSIPPTEARDCDVVTDSAGSDGALVIVWPGYTTGGFCQTPRLFHSADGGATWTAVSWAAPSSLTPCDTRFALDGGAIFAWSSLALVFNPLPASATGRLIVTRDNGASWTAADAGLDDDSDLALVGFRAGGRILATTPDVRGPPGASQLMESSDYGASWRELSDLPGAFPTVYVSTDPGLTDGWGRLYEIAQPLIGGVPADESHVILATATPGSAWTLIPLPPLASSAGDTVSVGLPVVVGVGPAGSLLVERGVVPGAHNAELGAARRLWAWSVSEGRWLRDPQPSLGNANLLGWSWGHGAQTIWITSLQLGVPPTLRLFTKTFTPASLNPAQ
ncbi:MAG TPA: hypothetical protein VFQ25_02945 [Ktedonobacterales bacterium]|nr:hypothetical protein [Ktedonobacterales bacterium]